MKTVCSFYAGKFASLISWVLSCFDRVIFKGHLPISRPEEFERFVDYRLKIRRADFLKVVAPAWSARLVDHAKAFAQKAGRVYEYLPGKVDKDAWAKEQLQRSPVEEGLIGILCVMETCRTFKLASGKDRPRLASRKMPQRVLYYYFMDRELGFMHPGAPGLADVRPLHWSGVRQGPQLRRAATEEERHRLRAGR